ncbi:MAG: DUF4262 domain-containing protein [Actinomycetota bacterium]
MDHEALLADWETRIERWGFTNIAVVGDPGPEYAYTAGLFHLGHPEFVIVGAPRQLAHDLLWDLGSAVVRSGFRFESGTTVNRLAANPMGIVAATDRPDDLVAVADRLRTRAGLNGPSSVLQVFFANREDVLPWGQNEDHLGFPIFNRHGAKAARSVDLPDRETRDADGWYPDS